MNSCFKVRIMNGKVYAIIMAAIMVAAVGVVLVDTTDSDADSNTSYGQFNIYVNYGSGWGTVGVADGYDACIALKDYASDNSLSISIDDATYTYSWGYYNINTNYGDLTTLGQMTENDNSKWNVIYYSTTGSGWTLGSSDALGYYKPFADYNTNFQTANIALYFGTVEGATSAMNSLPTTGLKSVVPMTTIINNPDFAVSFFIKIDGEGVLDDVFDIDGSQPSIASPLTITKNDLLNGITITGYGSDIYLALKNAVGSSNISAVEAVPGQDNGSYITNYSWMNSLFGLSTVFVDDCGTDDWSDDIYAWWIQYTSYTDDSNVQNDVKSDFVLGYYSPLQEAPNTLASYSLIYCESTA